MQCRVEGGFKVYKTVIIMTAKLLWDRNVGYNEAKRKTD